MSEPLLLIQFPLTQLLKEQWGCLSFIYFCIKQQLDSCWISVHYVAGDVQLYVWDCMYVFNMTKVHIFLRREEPTCFPCRQYTAVKTLITV